MHSQSFWHYSLRYLLLLLLSAWTLKSCSQEAIYKSILQELDLEIPEDTDLSELEETLNWITKHPLDLNNTSPEALRKLFFLSPLQIAAFFDYVRKNGKLINLLELQAVPNFDVKTISYLLPFVTLNTVATTPSGILRQIGKSAEQELLLRYGRVLEHQKGYGDLPGSHYLGDPGKGLMKYKFRVKDLLSASFVAEKDAGEPFFRQSTNIDFLSWHVAYNGKQLLRQVIVGDYSFQFGQGLSLWSGFGYGKGADVTTLSKNDAGLRPYTSTNESSFLRGLAIALKPAKSWVWTVFVSKLNQDATLREQPDGTLAQVTISESGLHRTATEIKNHDALGQTLVGNTLQYRSSALEFGILAYQTTYSHPFIKGTALYNQFNFTGNMLRNTSVSYNYTYRNIYLYGETAKSFPGGQSTINGVLVSVAKQLSFAVLNRMYGKQYHTFIGHSLGENTDAKNENAWYFGLNFQPNTHWLLSAATDRFNFQSAKYRIDSASAGFENLIQLIHTPNKTFKVVARFKVESKAQNSDDRHTLPQVIKLTSRMSVNWALNRSVGLESRIEMVRYRKGPMAETGFLFYQDLACKMRRALKFTSRIAWFKTDSYNSRLYAYEDDILYSSGFGLYQGKGIRTYLNITYDPVKRLSLYLRYACFMYRDVATVGSGLDIIEGNKKSEVKLQGRLQF
ncbi:helix-hairpin-helix domain-containing protein [Pedobacter duraquae]|uniref:Helix-hairpin-helix protein n=1 Tax=Pedobacter duraquae TaxID=425511 RepID=A0A4R6IFA2_9SPHI|nr:helix-hairpin-helix domain-containing protein [Pedobacter duraquae]TDO21010.1 hypothetical protein CLV32_3648 [Pedobacter duraquae]